MPVKSKGPCTPSTSGRGRGWAGIAATSAPRGPRGPPTQTHTPPGGDALNLEDLVSRCQRKAGPHHPADPGQGRRGLGAASLSSPPARPPSEPLCSPGGPPPNSLLPFQVPRSPEGPRPRASSPTEALKGEKADSLRCPLKPPLHFHGPRCRWLARRSTPEVTSCFGARTRVPAATRPLPGWPPAAGPASRINSLVHSPPRLGIGWGGWSAAPSHGERLLQARTPAKPQKPWRDRLVTSLTSFLSLHLAAEPQALSEPQSPTCGGWGSRSRTPISISCQGQWPSKDSSHENHPPGVRSTRGMWAPAQVLALEAWVETQMFCSELGFAKNPRICGCSLSGPWTAL